MPDKPAAIPSDVPLRTAKLLVDTAELARLTSLSVRTLRRMDASGEIPGRVQVRRRVLFRIAIIEEWVRAGMPGHEAWLASQQHRPSR